MDLKCEVHSLSQKSSQMSKDAMISGIHQNQTMEFRKLLGYVRSARDLMQIISIRNACLYRDFVFSKNNSFENRIPANVLDEISLDFLALYGGGRGAEFFFATTLGRCCERLSFIQTCLV